MISHTAAGQACLKAEPLLAAIDTARAESAPAQKSFICRQVSGLQSRLHDLAQGQRLNFVCGRYEGVDERVIELAVDIELSIGDYVLSGGEIPALALIDGLARLLPGVLGDAMSTKSESLLTDASNIRSIRVPRKSPDGECLRYF